MEIQILTSGKTFANHGSGFAVILKSISNVWKRSFAYGKMSANQAEMAAIKFGILSIADTYRNAKVSVFTTNKYVRDLFEKDDDNCYKIVPKANKDEVDELRELSSKFSNINFVKPEDNSECSDLATAAIKENIEINEKN